MRPSHRRQAAYPCAPGWGTLVLSRTNRQDRADSATRSPSGLSPRECSSTRTRRNDAGAAKDIGTKQIHGRRPETQEALARLTLRYSPVPQAYAATRPNALRLQRRAPSKTLRTSNESRRGG